MGKPVTEKKKGRPIGSGAIQIDKEQLERLMSYRPTLYDTAGFFKCERSTVQRFINKHYNMDFMEFRKIYMSDAKLSLIQKAMEKAQGGDNEMLRYCINNLAGWTNGHKRDDRFDDEDFVDEIEWVDE